MTSHVFNEFKRASAAGEIALASADVRVALLATGTSAMTQNAGVVVVSQITTLDECDGTNYARKELESQAVTKDDTNSRAEFDATDCVWSALGANSTGRTVAGALLFLFNTNDASSMPIAWVEFAMTPDGSDFTLQWNAEGILQLS